MAKSLSKEAVRVLRKGIVRPAMACRSHLPAVSVIVIHAYGYNNRACGMTPPDIHKHASVALTPLNVLYVHVLQAYSNF